MLGYYDPSVSFRSGSVQGEISGRVTNDQGEPVSSASIMVKGSYLGSSTDVNGYFKLRNVPSGSVLNISSVGFENKEITAYSGYLSVALTPGHNSLDEVVVAGYGMESRPAGLDVTAFAAKKKDITMQTVAVSTQYQPTTTTYNIQEKYTLESDGKSTTIAIKQFEVPAIYSYYIAPKIDPGAFLTTKIISWQDYDIQSGEASLYYEGSYLGKTYIDLGSAEDTLSLSLGKDNGIKVTRKLLKEYSSKKFIGSNRTDSRQYEISIRNVKRMPVSIILADQFPVSTNKDITVEDAKATDATINKETGIVTWAFTLPPTQEKKLGISFSVKYPKDRKLNYR